MMNPRKWDRWHQLNGRCHSWSDNNQSLHCFAPQTDGYLCCLRYNQSVPPNHVIGDITNVFRCLTGNDDVVNLVDSDCPQCVTWDALPVSHSRPSHDFLSCHFPAWIVCKVRYPALRLPYIRHHDVTNLLLTTRQGVNTTTKNLLPGCNKVRRQTTVWLRPLKLASLLYVRVKGVPKEAHASCIWIKRNRKEGSEAGFPGWNKRPRAVTAPFHLWPARNISLCSNNTQLHCNVDRLKSSASVLSPCWCAEGLSRRKSRCF